MNPATEKPIDTISLGGLADVHAAVAAPRHAHLNGAGPDFNAPFDGYKQSRNARQWGTLGLEAYLETSAIISVGT